MVSRVRPLVIGLIPVCKWNYHRLRNEKVSQVAEKAINRSDCKKISAGHSVHSNSLSEWFRRGFGR